tara:strand:+ start:7130 stop:8269 length:1140 start_codon:yes stop_codon:yes gene_type:complete
MTIKASATPKPPLSFTEIAREFGNSGIQPGSISLGRYRTTNGQGAYPITIGSITFGDLDSGIPTGNSTIKVSQFYSKKLSFVVDYHSFSADRDNSTAHVDAEVRWRQGSTTQVGNFRSTPASGDWNSGKRVFINYNQTFGSVRNTTQSVVALRTGQFWPNDTEMIIEVGPNGKIFGAGGKGGNGSNGSGRGGNGQNGNSALGIDITTNSGNKSCAINVRNGGFVQCGFEGGGGGGGSYDDPSKSQTDPVSSGGGGGGGAGRPVGLGGNAGTGAQKASNGAPGFNASNTARGLGGGGGNPNEGGSEGGDGGNGGQSGTAAEGGDNGSGGNQSNGGGGSTGGRGAAIRKRDATCGYTLNIDSGGQVIGDGFNPATAPLGVN